MLYLANEYREHYGQLYSGHFNSHMSLNMNCFIRCVTLALTWFLVCTPVRSAAESGAALTKRNGLEGKRDRNRLTKPKLDLSVPAPSELMPTEERELSKRVGRKIPTIDGENEEGQSAESSAPLPNTMDGLNDTRMLGIGDRLSFKVVEDEIAPRSLVVTDSLEIDVPYIGRVPVGKKTCKQFAFYVKSALEKEYYHRATVLVGLDAAGNATRAASRGKIYVMGQVRSPGPMDIPMDEAFTVTKAILRAGGFGPYANKRKVKLIRGGKYESLGKPIIIDCAEILDKGHWSKDVELKPEDIITVPEKLISIF